MRKGRRELAKVLVAALVVLSATSTGCAGKPPTQPGGLASALQGGLAGALPGASGLLSGLSGLGGLGSQASGATPVGASTTTEPGLPGEDSGSPEPGSVVVAGSGDRTHHAVLLVHGLGVGAFSMMAMQAHLTAQGLAPVETIDLPSAGLTNTLEECAAAVEARVQEMKARGIEKVDLVGHSMGGLVIREYLRARRDTSVQVPTLITVATPNLGNGKVAGLLGLNGVNNATTQMAVGSDFLNRLNSSPTPAGTRAIGLRTLHDEVVRDTDACKLPGGENLVVDVGTVGAHLAMGFHATSLATIHALLVGASPPA